MDISGRLLKSRLQRIPYISVVYKIYKGGFKINHAHFNLIDLEATVRFLDCMSTTITAAILIAWPGTLIYS